MRLHRLRQRSGYERRDVADDRDAAGHRSPEGEISAVALVKQHLARIAEVNPAVNAVTQVLADQAFQDAAELDGRHAAGVALGLPAGVPCTVKESIAVAGVPTTHGA